MGRHLKTHTHLTTDNKRSPSNQGCKMCINNFHPLWKCQGVPPQIPIYINHIKIQLRVKSRRRVDDTLSMNYLLKKIWLISQTLYRCSNNSTQCFSSPLNTHTVAISLMIKKNQAHFWLRWHHPLRKSKLSLAALPMITKKVKRRKQKRSGEMKGHKRPSWNEKKIW